MNRLEEIAAQRHTDKLDHGYLPHYRAHLPGGALCELPRDAEFSLLEVGIFEGNSLRMWRDYFPNASIYGVDIEPSYIFKENRIITWLGNATLAEFWEDKEIPNLQVIVDDGSHHSEDMISAFFLLWPKLPSGGLYVIEDLATQYMSHYGGSEDGSPAIKVLRGFMDGILSPLLRPYSCEMHVYNEIVFLTKV